MKDTYANFEQNLRETVAVARRFGRASDRQHSGDECKGLRAVRVDAPGRS